MAYHRPYAAAANTALDFYRVDGPAAPLDIRPGGALKASSRFIRGSLRCARNVNARLYKMGYRGTKSDMARSFLTYGQPIASPRIGAVQVERRGWSSTAGHVQMVVENRNGVWYCDNPSSRIGDWVRQPCANPRVIAYRMPTAADLLQQRIYAGNAAKPRREPFPVTASAYAPPIGYLGTAIMTASFIPSSYGVAR
jgi:hypothetical protein